jgi:hypothetical protein
MTECTDGIGHVMVLSNDKTRRTRGGLGGSCASLLGVRSALGAPRLGAGHWSRPGRLRGLRQRKIR